MKAQEKTENQVGRKRAFSCCLYDQLIELDIERLILEKGRLPQEDMTDDLKCRESFIKNLKESFSVIENKYNVSLNEREILMIYYLTENN